MTNKLEEKIQETELKIPNIREVIKPYNGATWGMHWNGSVQDICYKELEKYYVVAARWNKHSWDEGGGGIKWTDWVSVYFFDKEDTTKKRIEETGEIVTRHQYDQLQDRRDLWGYNNVEIFDVTDNTLKVAWVNKESLKGPTYKINY